MSDIEESLQKHLRFTAARFFLGGLQRGEAIRTIEAAMKTGLWRDEFLAMLDCQPILREVTQPFGDCLHALGVTVKSYEEALLAIVDFHTRAIALGMAAPLLEDLFNRDLRTFDFDLSCDRRLIEASGACRLRDLHQSYPDFLFDDDWSPKSERDRAFTAYQEDILKEAVRWQYNRRAAGAVSHRRPRA